MTFFRVFSVTRGWNLILSHLWNNSMCCFLCFILIKMIQYRIFLMAKSKCSLYCFWMGCHRNTTKRRVFSPRFLLLAGLPKTVISLNEQKTEIRVLKPSLRDPLLSTSTPSGCGSQVWRLGTGSPWAWSPCELCHCRTGRSLSTGTWEERIKYEWMLCIQEVSSASVT